MRPTNRVELSSWIRHKLGEPVIRTSELDPTQLDDAIDQAMDYFTEFAGGVGHEEQYCIIQTKTAEELNAMSICTTPLSGTPFSFCEDTKLAAPYMQYRQEYQLPRDVIAVSNIIQNGQGINGGLNWLTNAPGKDIISQGIDAATNMSDNIGIGGSFMGGSLNTSINNNMGLFFPGVYFSGGAYGSRGGDRGGGSGPDLITYELSLEYMEMLNQRYRTSVNVSFLESERKVRISPAISMGGLFILGVWSRVADKYLYDNMFIKLYSLAICKKQIGQNMKKFKNARLGGGAELDGDFYYTEGKEEMKDLEKQMLDNQWGYPADFQIG